MQQFIRKSLLILLPIFLSGISMEGLLRHIPNDYQYKKAYLDTHASEIETLILGSSHAYYGLNPAYFSGKAFNASHVSQTLDYDHQLLKKYESRFQHLQTIVVPVSAFTLYEKLSTGPQGWRVKNYTIYYDLPTSISLQAFSEVLSHAFSFNVRRLGRYYIKGAPNITCSPLGWGTVYHSSKAKDLEETAREAAARHNKALHSPEIRELFTENTQVLNEILAWGEEKGIQVLLLTLPAYGAYREKLDPEQLRITIEVARSAAQAHPHCRYLNLLDDPDFSPGDYYDADHLSEIGAEKLSWKVSEAIRGW